MIRILRMHIPLLMTLVTCSLVAACSAAPDQDVTILDDPALEQADRLQGDFDDEPAPEDEDEETTQLASDPVDDDAEAETDPTDPDATEAATPPLPYPSAASSGIEREFSLPSRSPPQD